MTFRTSPSNATDKSVTWTLVSGSGHASITQTGVVTARSNGTVIIRATANDGSGAFGEVEIVINNQIVAVSSIKVKINNKYKFNNS